MAASGAAAIPPPAAVGTPASDAAMSASVVLREWLQFLKRAAY